MEGDQNESPSVYGICWYRKDLNHILSTFVDSEDEVNNISKSNYVTMADSQSIFQTGQSYFVIATLNIQSINEKFDSLCNYEQSICIWNFFWRCLSSGNLVDIRRQCDIIWNTRLWIDTPRFKMLQTWGSDYILAWKILLWSQKSV